MRELRQRKNIRLKDYDYSRNGHYFITICVKDKHEMLGTIMEESAGYPRMILSDCGKIVQSWINKISDKFPYIAVKNHVVMPNHIHMLLFTHASDEEKPLHIGKIIGYFKYNAAKEMDISEFWQRSYHDHIIHNEKEYQKISQYIDANPSRWKEDMYFIR